MASIYQRGTTWWGRIYRGQEYRKSLGTSNKRVAERRFRKWIDEIEASDWGENPRRYFDEAMASFILKHLPTLRESSQTRYMISVKFLKGHLKGKFLDEIDSSALAEFEAARRAQGVKAPTIRRDLSCLSSMFTHVEYDLDWGWEGNPATAFMKRQKRRGRLKESKPHTRYLDTKEEEALLLAARGINRGADLLHDQIAFAIDTGLRLGELFSLRWSQVKLDKRELIIPTESSKGKREGVVPLVDRSAQILAQMPRRLRVAEESDWVFHKKNGDRWFRRDKVFAYALKAAGIKGVVWHDLRRTCGCRLLQKPPRGKGMAMEEVRDWLRHANLQQTERAYAFLKTEQLKESAGVRTKLGTGRMDSESANSE